jgi:ER lumen protein retaining receptor
MILNEFRLVGDFLHDFAILLLIFNIIKTRSCHSVSGMTTILYLITFSCRYLDLLPFFVSSSEFLTIYNTIFKIYYLLSNCFILFLIYGLFRHTRDKSDDTLSAFSYLIFAHILNWGTCYFNNYKYIDKEFFWQFSIYLEMFAIIPQLNLIYKQGTINKIMTYYLVMLGSYRAFYVLNWIYRYNMEGFWDPICFYCGCVQTIIYLCFFIYVYPHLNKENKYQSIEVKKDLINVVDIKEKTTYDVPLIHNIDTV